MRKTAANNQISIELAARGLRATRQRTGVLELLRATHDHLTAASLCGT